jgi:hypothetical protein
MLGNNIKDLLEDVLGIEPPVRFEQSQEKMKETSAFF